MNALVMRLETRADQAAAAGENDLAAMLWEAAAAVALGPSPDRCGCYDALERVRQKISVPALPSFAWAKLAELGFEPSFFVTLSSSEAAVWKAQGLEVISLVRRSEVEQIIRSAGPDAHSR